MSDTADRRTVGRCMAGYLLLCVLLAGCGSQDISSGAQAKADELQAKLAPLGISVPEGKAASLYDDDGGYLCAAAGEDGQLEHVSLVGHRFAAHKTNVDPKDIAFARAVIEVYCPDELAAFNDFADGLEQGEDGT